ncbi:MAG: sugar phosphate nucleotidyltransferase, partial [Acidobacteriota bacterium]
AANLVVQPRNRGTAPAVLLSLLRILSEDAEAKVIILPCDHFVAQEHILRSSLQEALASAKKDVVLLGAEPRRTDTDLGWIQPLHADDSKLLRVDSFVEKPDWHTAIELKRQGGLLNMLILAASGEALLDLFRRATPELLNALGEVGFTPKPPPTRAISAAYGTIPVVDFSHDVLERVAGDAELWVKVVPQCGWFDVGTPARLATLPLIVGERSRWYSIDDETQRLGSDYWLG